MSTPERQQTIDDLVARYRKLLEQRLPHAPQTLDQIEQTVEEISRQLEQELEQRILEQQQPPPSNRAACPHCGRAVRYRSTHARVLITCHGEHALDRRYYYCSLCQQGFAPLDARLGLDAGATSPQLRLWLAHLAAWQPFDATVASLQLLTGVRVSAATVERTAVAVGGALGAAQRQTAADHHQGRLPAAGHHPQQLYISMDGVMTPLRNPWKRDGTAGKLVCRFGECKIGAVYEVRPGPDGRLRAHHSVYTATLAGVEAFAPLIATLAHQRGQHWARELIVLGDGAAWIWRLVAAQFAGAIEIVDFYHACQHLAGLAEAQFGRGTAAAKAWVEARKEELLGDRLGAVLAAIGAWEPEHRDGEKLRQKEYAYFAGNAERMRYGTFRQKGYQIASGVIESACKHVVASRVDQAGMHWRQETAEALICLRAAVRSAEAPDLKPHCRLAA
jgi:hypothetical protein